MPALPNVPQVIRIDLIHQDEADLTLGSRFFNRYSGGAPSVSDMNSLAGFVEGFWATHCAPMLNGGAALIEVVCTDLTTPSSAQGNWTGHTAGSRSGAQLPIATAALINFTIARRYRGGKPRMYAPWGVETDLASGTNNQWSTSFITAATSAWSAFQGGLDGQGFGSSVLGQQQNVSYYHGFLSAQNPVTLRWRNIPTPRATAQVDPIGSFTVNTFLGSQRRRTRA